ncbi:MAG: hypothetical protein ACKVOK_04635 [Flavobacteriales bacterium]
MNLDTLPSFRVFYDETQANVFAQNLLDEGIETWVVDDATVVDGNIIGAAAQTIYRVKLKLEDFPRANELLINQAELRYTSIPEDHYLLQFTLEELKDILNKPYEWSADDLVLARMIMKSKNQGELIAPELNGLSTNSEAAFTPKSWTNREIIMVYISLLFFGMTGIVLGLMMWRSKKTLPDGTIIYANSSEDRAHGKIIFMIGLAVFLLEFIGAMVKY